MRHLRRAVAPLSGRAFDGWRIASQQYQPQILNRLLQNDATQPRSSFSAAAAAAATGTGGVKHLGPSVRILLEGSGLDASSLLPGSGPHGILTKGDVLHAIASRPPSSSPSPLSTAPPSPLPPAPPAAPAPAAGGGVPKAAAAAAPAVAYQAASSIPKASSIRSSSSLAGLPTAHQIPTTQMRKIIAQRLLESKRGSPHFYAEAEAIIDDTLLLRKRLKESLGVSVSVNDFVIKAVAAALHQVPEANVTWDDKKKQLVQQSGIDISVAVATEKGLFTPIVKDAYSKSLSAISAEVKSLAAKARSGKLMPHEFQGGSFSISNLGMFPIDRFAAIINPPQPCILAVGRGERVVRWPNSSASSGLNPQVVTKMEVTLSADARAVGAPVAGRFLAALCENLKDPTRLVV